MAHAIENLVDGAFFNSGQSCCGIERIYVHKKVWADFLDGFVDLTKKYVLGSPLDQETTLGPMVRAGGRGIRPEADRVRGAGRRKGPYRPQVVPAGTRGARPTWRRRCSRRSPIG